MKVILLLACLTMTFCLIENANIHNLTINVDVKDINLLEDLKQNILQTIKNVYIQFKTPDLGKELTATTSSFIPSNTTTDFIMDKRSSESSERWLCSTTAEWKHLGNGYYPEYIRETLCSQRHCIQGNYGCQPYFYRVLVMKRRDNDGSPEDTNMPSRLRRHWEFSEIDLSVGCECRPLL